MLRRARAGLIPAAAFLLGVWSLAGCGGDDGGTTGPELGAEVDLSLYSPTSIVGLYATFRSMTHVDTVEASTWYVGTEPVYDPDAEEPIEVECTVIQEEPDNIFSVLGEMRTYSDDQYVYGIKVYGGGTWEPLYYFRPKMKIAPDENPRINGVFDSDGSSFVFTYETEGLRDVFWIRSWTTYLAIEDSVTVPAGTFYDCLKTKERQRVHVKRTTIIDTTNVIPGSVFTGESESFSWQAPGIGVIRITAGSGTDFAERVLVSGTFDGVDYPIVKGNRVAAFGWGPSLPRTAEGFSDLWNGAPPLGEWNPLGFHSLNTGW